MLRYDLDSLLNLNFSIPVNKNVRIAKMVFFLPREYFLLHHNFLVSVICVNCVKLHNQLSSIWHKFVVKGLFPIRA